MISKEEEKIQETIGMQSWEKQQFNEYFYNDKGSVSNRCYIYIAMRWLKDLLYNQTKNSCFRLLPLIIC